MSVTQSMRDDVKTWGRGIVMSSQGCFETSGQISRRRFFAACSAGMAAFWAGHPLAADRKRRGGILIGTPDEGGDQIERDVRLSLADEGWPDDATEVRVLFGDNDLAQIARYAAELVAWTPDVLVCVNTPATAATQNATAELPIVFAHVSDPVGMKFVQSYAAPGGNITGFSNFEASLGGKWLELLKQIAPGITHVQMIANPIMLSGLFYVTACRSAAERLGIAFDVVEVDGMPRVQAAVADVAATPGGGLVFSSDAWVHANYQGIVAAVNARGVPAMYPFVQDPIAGGLVAYTVNEDALYLGAGHYAGRILNGAQPRDLPVQGPNKFDLIINLSTAAAQGITVPPGLLAAATQVIE